MINFIVPNGEGGVADYSACLSSAVGGRVLSFGATGEGIETRIKQYSQSGEQTIIYLQYSGYGYQSRGVPLALLGTMRRMKRQGMRIGIFFHELYAFGRPWNSSFWLSPAQRHVCAELARLADFWMTNRCASADWLLRAGGRKPYAVLPVFSNVGEAEQYRVQRQRVLIVFGSAGMRQRAYIAGGSSLLHWAAAEGLRIIDIGAAMVDRDLVERLKSIGASMLGRLPVEAVAKYMSDAAMGLVAYPLSFIAKSSVFAAYAAHGVAPIVCSDSGECREGLRENEQYLRWSIEYPPRVDTSYAAGLAVFEWYKAHNVDAHRRALGELLDAS